MRAFRLLVLPGCATVLLAGCGGGSGTRLSRADYVRQADAICARYDARQTQLGSPKSVADLVRFSAKLKPLQQSETKELRALKAPDALKDDADAAYDTFDASAEKLGQLGTAAKAGDTKQITDIANQGASLSRKASGLAGRLGLKVCGKGS